MAVSVPTMYNGMYLGRMTVPNAEIILKIRESKSV